MKKTRDYQEREDQMRRILSLGPDSPMAVAAAEALKEKLLKSDPPWENDELATFFAALGAEWLSTPEAVAALRPHVGKMN